MTRSGSLTCLKVKPRWPGTPPTCLPDLGLKLRVLCGWFQGGSSDGGKLELWQSSLVTGTSPEIKRRSSSRILVRSCRLCWLAFDSRSCNRCSDWWWDWWSLKISFDLFSMDLLKRLISWRWVETVRSKCRICAEDWLAKVKDSICCSRSSIRLRTELKPASKCWRMIEIWSKDLHLNKWLLRDEINIRETENKSKKLLLSGSEWWKNQGPQIVENVLFVKHLNSYMMCGRHSCVW